MDRDDPPDTPADLLRDWITVWHSELAALAADRELAESAQVLVDLWANAASAALRQAGPPLNDRDHGPTGPAGAAAAPGAAPAVAAPDDGADELRRLRERVADLERRLAALELRRRRTRT